MTENTRRSIIEALNFSKLSCKRRIWKSLEGTGTELTRQAPKRKELTKAKERLCSPYPGLSLTTILLPALPSFSSCKPFCSCIVVHLLTHICELPNFCALSVPACRFWLQNTSSRCYDLFRSTAIARALLVTTLPPD